MKRLFPVGLFTLILCGQAFAGSLAGLVVSTGYNDGFGGGGTPVPPNPWYGSANTTFYGSSSDLADAPGSDPDLSGVLLQNVGASPITIGDLSITSLDLFTRAGIAGSLTLSPGQNFIFADGDGSDDLPGDQKVSFTANSITVSVADAITAAQPDGVLSGNMPWINGVETVAWTRIYAGSSTVPESSTWAMMLLGFAGLGVAGYRARKFELVRRLNSISN